MVLEILNNLCLSQFVSKLNLHVSAALLIYSEPELKLYHFRLNPG